MKVEEVERLMAQMKNIGWLRTIDLTPLSEESLTSLYHWLRFLKNDIDHQKTNRTTMAVSHNFS